MRLLPQFLYLQLLDVLTTLAFLANGAQEANPIVRYALDSGAPPVLVLAVVKVFAALLALYCVRADRLKLLGRVNVFFAMLVAWNLVVIIITGKAIAS